MTQTDKIAVQDAMLDDLTDEQLARYIAIMNPHANCPHAPYCAVDHLTPEQRARFGLT